MIKNDDFMTDKRLLALSTKIESFDAYVYFVKQSLTQRVSWINNNLSK